MPRLILLVSLAVAAGMLSPRTRPLAGNTLLLSFTTAALAAPLGALLAVLLARIATPLRRLWIALLAAALFLPLYLQAAGWNAGFGQLGWQTVWSGRVGDHVLSGWRAAIWIHVCAATPWAALIIGQGLRQVPRKWEEAALLDGSPRQMLWQVTLPAAGGAVLAAVLWTVVMVAAEMTVADLFLIRTYAEELYQGFALETDVGGVVASVLPGVVALAGMSVAAALLLARWAKTWSVGGEAEPLPLLPGNWLHAAVVAAILGVMFLVPLGSLVWQAGAGADGFRLSQAIHQVRDSAVSFHREVLWSLVIGAAAATLALAVAVPLALLAWRGGWRALPALTAAAAGLAVPGPLWALAVIWLLNRPPWEVIYTRTIAGPVLAIAMRCLPLAVLVVWHAVRTLPSHLMEAAELDGASARVRWMRIAWPLRSGALLAAWLLCCAIAVGDLAASILVMPPAVETASVRLFGLIHSGVREQEAGLALVMVGVAAALSGLGLAAASRWTSRDPSRVE